MYNSTSTTESGTYHQSDDGVDYIYQRNDGSHHRESIRGEYRIIITCVVVCVIIFTTLGNLVTVIVVRMDKRLKTVSNLYLASLAIADLLVGACVMPLMLLYTVTFDGTWAMGSALCDIWHFVDYVSCNVSLTNVCAIAWDRYQTVSQPLRAIHNRTRRKAYKAILFAWLAPIISWAAIVISLRLANGRPESSFCYLIWEPHFAAVIVAAMFIYLPLLVILGLFFTIMNVLKQHMHLMNERMARTSSLRERAGWTICEDTTSERSGGVSFNARLSVDDTNQNIATDGHRTIPLVPFNLSDARYIDTMLNEKNMLAMSQFRRKSSVDIEICRGGRHFRHVGTNTSPERFGLVRTIATNTTASLQKLDGLESTECSEALLAEHILRFTSRLDSASEFQSEESDTDTVHTASLSSESPSRAYQVEPDLLQCEPKWRRRYASLLRAQREANIERSRLRQQVKAARTLGVIMAFLLVCWLPFSVLWPIKTFCPSCILQRTYDISIWTNYLNSSINPVIYCLCNPHFRRAFKRILTRK